MHWGVHAAVDAAKEASRSMRKTAFKTAKTTVNRETTAAIWNIGPSLFSYRSISRKIDKHVGKLDKHYNRHAAIKDYKNLGKNGVKRINERMKNGETYKRAKQIEVGRHIATKVATNIAKDYAIKAAASAAVTIGAQYVMSKYSDMHNIPRLPYDPKKDPIDIGNKWKYV